MYNLIKQLENTSSRKEKEAILESLKGTQDEQIFKYIAYLTYDPAIDFYVKEFEAPTEFVQSMTLLEALKDLQNIIAMRHLTGNMARQWIEMTMGSLSDEDAEVFKRVVKRDLLCGASAKTINKVFPDTIYVHPYMRCSSLSEKTLKKISLPCYSQTKMDGLYCDIIVTKDGVDYRTRNGSYMLFNEEERDKELLQNFAGKVFMGEALALHENSTVVMDRQSSNGYLNSDDVDPERVVFYVWDLVDEKSFYENKCNRPYSDRYSDLCDALSDSDCFNYLHIVDTKECHSQNDLIEHLKEKINEGEEGTVIKDKAMIWKPGTSTQQIKCKIIFDCDLVVTGYKMGTNSNEDKLGAITCETSDGKLSVSAGTGFTKKQRDDLLKVVDDWIETGQIVTIRGNGVITNENNPDKYSIFLPRFVEARNDKNEADSLERVQEQVQAFITTLEVIK